METYDVVVIGCGILGASTGLACSKANLSTLVLEQYSTHFHSNGGSFGASRCWRTAYANPIYANMMLNALKLWKDIEQRTDTKLLRYCGGLDFGPTHCVAMKQVLSTLRSLGHPYEHLTAQQAMQRFHPIKLPPHFSAIYTPQHYGTVDASKALNAMLQYAQSLGCHVEYNCKVGKIEKLQHKKYKVVTADNKVYFAKHVVLSCGAYQFPQIVDRTKAAKDELNERMKWLMRSALKSTGFNTVYYRHATTSEQAWINEAYPVWAEYDEQRDVCLWYGMMEERQTPFGSVWCHKIGDSASTVVPFESEANCDYEHLRKYAAERFGADNAKLFELKKCYVTETKDDNFVIDQIAPNESIYAVIGSHTFKHAPEIGEMVKKMIVNEVRPHPMFWLDRFVKSKL